MYIFKYIIVHIYKNQSSITIISSLKHTVLQTSHKLECMSVTRFKHYIYIGDVSFLVFLYLIFFKIDNQLKNMMFYIVYLNHYELNQEF